MMMKGGDPHYPATNPALKAKEMSNFNKTSLGNYPGSKPSLIQNPQQFTHRKSLLNSNSELD